jgi:hypothetical protein
MLSGFCSSIRPELLYKIEREELHTKNFFYSAVKKAKKNIGHKDVLLIFCPEDDELFYSNQYELKPFISDEGNLSKWKTEKGVAHPTLSAPIFIPNKKCFNITFPMRYQNDIETQQEWKFVMANENMVNLWA